MNHAQRFHFLKFFLFLFVGSATYSSVYIILLFFSDQYFYAGLCEYGRWFSFAGPVRQPAAMAQSAITADINQAFEIHADLGAKRALYFMFCSMTLRKLAICSSVSLFTLISGLTLLSSIIFWR
jgi:hypothetical protein